WGGAAGTGLAVPAGVVAVGAIEPGSVNAGGVVSFTVRPTLAVPVQPLAAVACTVNGNEPSADGVPIRTPDPLRAMPGGSLPPAVANVYGPVPPDAVIVSEYAKPYSAAGSAAVTVTTGHATRPVRVTLRVPPLTLVTVSVAVL